MSCDTLFTCHYNGRFKMVNGVTTYNGGEVHLLECQAQSLITNMPDALHVSLYGQRMWYKFPFEDMNQLKLLCDGSENFQKMCEASVWTLGFDIFLKEDNIDEGCDVGRGGADHGEASRGYSNVDFDGCHNVEIGLGYEHGATLEEDGKVDVEIGGDPNRMEIIPDEADEDILCWIERSSGFVRLRELA